MTQQPARRARNVVGISLMGSAETEAVVAYLQDHVPDAVVHFRNCFYKIERAGLLEIDLNAVGEYLGRPLDLDMFLVNLSSYFGRIVVADGKFQVHAEIQPEPLADD